MARAPPCPLQSLVLHAKAFGKFINSPGKKKHCTIVLFVLLYYHICVFSVIYTTVLFSRRISQNKILR